MPLLAVGGAGISNAFMCSAFGAVFGSKSSILYSFICGLLPLFASVFRFSAFAISIPQLDALSVSSRSHLLGRGSNLDLAKFIERMKLANDFKRCYKRR